jgi:hypothetical protein
MNRNKNRDITALILVITLLVTLNSIYSVRTVNATQGTPESALETSSSFVFHPSESGFGSFFDETIESGTSAELEVLVGNTGSVDQQLRVYPVDAFTAPGGGFATANVDDDIVNAPTGWISFPNEIIKLSPQEGKTITFSVSVPEDTPPGEYIAALAAEQADEQSVAGSDVFTQRLRFIIPIMITVPGNGSVSFDVGEATLRLDRGFSIFTLELRNTGDLRVRPEGTIDLIRENGELAATLPVAMSSVYARETTELNVAIEGYIDGGPFTARAELVDGQSGIEVTREFAEINYSDDEVAESVASPIQIIESDAQANPSDENVQFVTIRTTIGNSDAPVSNAQLSLLVSKDGEEIEKFAISQSLALPQGETEIEARYIPIDGFSSGTWTFEILLETVSPSGTSVVVATQPIETEVVVP